MSILQVNQVSKAYGKNQVLRDVSLQIEEPGIIALVGPNGVGKTTLLNIIANLIFPDKGEVKLFGLSNRDSQVFHRVSYLIDNRVLYGYLTGLDHLKYIAEARKLDKAAVEEAIQIFDISSFLTKKVQDYSLGMKQQLLFTIAFMGKPDLLMMDEPFNGLDPSNIIRVRNIMKKAAAQGRTILLSSHNLAEIDQLTSQIVFVKDGNLIQEDISQYQSSVYLFRVDKPESALSQLSSVWRIEQDRLMVTAGSQELDRLITELSQITPILDMSKELRGAEHRYNELYL